MILKLRAVSPHKAGLISGAIFATFTLVIWPFFLIGSIFMKSSAPAGAFPPFFNFFFMALPFIYGIMGYISMAVMCIIHNFYSKRIGCIQLTFESVEPISPNPAQV
jgi:hypothetical protein